MLYQLETKAVNRAVKGHLDRFPHDFMFQLTAEQTECLRCQIGTSNESADGLGRGGRRYLSYAFTEQGITMLSGILTSNPSP
jgi:hypothetical protein